MTVLAHVTGSHAGLTLAAAAAFTAVLLAPRARSLLVAVCAFGFALQLFHGLEHVAQTVAWVREPALTPWLSQWAAAGRDGLAVGLWRQRGTATEVLHLAGNLVFLVALTAGSVVARPAGRGWWLRRGLAVQGVHVAEHLLLVTTLLVTGRAEGLTTLFGLINPPSQLAFGFRVLLHLAFNLAGCYLLIRAVPEVAAAHRSGRPVTVTNAALPPGSR